MRAFIFTFTSLLLLSWAASAQSKSPLRFEAYPVHERFLQKSNRPKLAEPRARMFRTMLRENAIRGVNFAGHYVAATWGCGADCLSFGIIDARTGHVYFIRSLLNVGGFGYSPNEDRLQFRANSRLLIVVGAPNDQGYVGKYYYLWKNNRLKLLRAVEDRTYRG